jgi:hypothetical protein
MKSTPEIVTVEEGGLIRLSQDVLTRLKVEVGDYLDVKEAGYRCLHFSKAESSEQDGAFTSK